MIRSIVPFDQLAPKNALVFVLLLSPFASAGVADLQTIIGAQNPSQWLQFSGDLSDSGSSPVAWTGDGLFADDFDGNSNSARRITANAQNVTTLTDVVPNAGSLSLIFRMPDTDFTGDRFLFDGGLDSGSDDDSFRLRWDDNPGEFELQIGNYTQVLNGPNLEDNNGQWFYFGMTWDDSINTPEGTAYFGQQGGTLFSTDVNPANAAVFGDNGSFVVGNSRTGSGAWKQSPAATNGDNGFLDEFAIWDAPLEGGQLAAQFDYFNGNVPPAPQPGAIEDRFNDGSRTAAPEGLNWYSINNNSSNPVLTVGPDPTGFNDGNALFADVGGSSNAEVLGVLGETVSLGSATGSQLSLKFDLRMQDLLLNASQFRFGLYADDDGELGTGGWGTSDGSFDRSSPGPLGDGGIFARIEIGTSGSVDGSENRIIEENNANTILGGSGDTETIASADGPNSGVIRNNSVYSVELVLERIAPSGDNDETVMSTLKLFDDQGVELYSLSGFDSDGVLAADSFDYFVAATTTNIDWVLDNFVIETLDVASSTGDYDQDGIVSAADYAVWRASVGDTVTAGSGADGDSSGTIDSGDYDAWVANFTTNSPAIAAAAVPEPASATFLLLVGAALPVLRRK